jgi:RHS repeat-associated protein
VIAEYENGAAPSSPTREYIYAGGQLLATHEGASLCYHHADHLSVRLVTKGTWDAGQPASANILAQQGHYPFGESWYTLNTTSKMRFTLRLRSGQASYERDSESLNDYAIFRTHINRLGRFNSPDPLAGSLSNPQSLNRYGYVLNVPTSLVDPLGLSPFSLFENTAPLLHDGTLAIGGAGTICYVDGARVPCGFAMGIVESGQGEALPPGVSPQGWAVEVNGEGFGWYSSRFGAGQDRIMAVVPIYERRLIIFINQLSGTRTGGSRWVLSHQEVIALPRFWRIPAYGLIQGPDHGENPLGWPNGVYEHDPWFAAVVSQAGNMASPVVEPSGIAAWYLASGIAGLASSGAITLTTIYDLFLLAKAGWFWLETTMPGCTLDFLQSAAPGPPIPTPCGAVGAGTGEAMRRYVVPK